MKTFRSVSSAAARDRACAAADGGGGPARGPGLYRGPAQPAAADHHHADRPGRAAAVPQPAAPAAAGEDAGRLRVSGWSRWRRAGRRPAAAEPGADARPRAAAATGHARQHRRRAGGAPGRPALHDAFKQLQDGDYAGAERGFKAFVQSNPKHPLAGNAQYWLGETYYARRDYQNAMVAFAEGYKVYKTSPKGPDNLLKLGITLAVLDKKPEACAVFASASARTIRAPPTCRSGGSTRSARRTAAGDAGRLVGACAFARADGAVRAVRDAARPRRRRIRRARFAGLGVLAHEWAAARQGRVLALIVDHGLRPEVRRRGGGDRASGWPRLGIEARDPRLVGRQARDRPAAGGARGALPAAARGLPPARHPAPADRPITPRTRPRPGHAGGPRRAGRTAWPAWRRWSSIATRACCGRCSACRGPGSTATLAGARRAAGSTIPRTRTAASSGPAAGRDGAPCAAGDRGRRRRGRPATEVAAGRCRTCSRSSQAGVAVDRLVVFARLGREIAGEAAEPGRSRPWAGGTIRRAGSGWSGRPQRLCAAADGAARKVRKEPGFHAFWLSS